MSGKIKAIKHVKVRGGENLVVTVQQDDKSVLVDLGRADDLNDLKLKKGDQVTTQGLLAMVGNKQIVLARQLNANSKEMDIDRKGRTVKGKVTGTHQSKVRGLERLIAIVEVEPNGDKMSVDLGPADKLSFQVKKGLELTFTGVPVKVKDKRLLIAQTVEHDGKTIQIARQNQGARKS